MTSALLKTEDEVFKKRMSTQGKRGGRTTKKRYGTDYYSKIGKLGGKKKKHA